MEGLERQEAFRSCWDSDSIASLDTAEVRAVVEFIAGPKDCISPSASAGRRFLMTFIKDSTAGAMEAVPKAGSEGPARRPPALGFQNSGVLSSAPAPKQNAGRAPVDKAGAAEPGPLHSSTRDGVTARAMAGLRLAPHVAKSVLQGEDEEDVEAALDHHPTDLSQAAALSIDQDFPGLPFKMQQLLLQGGPKFKELFEPLRYEVTSPKDMELLLRYFHESQRLIWGVCHSAGLDIDPANCKAQLEKQPVFRVRPERRRENNLSFPPTQRRAPFEISRFLSEGSVRTFVENLAARAGNSQKDSAEGHLARQILFAGLALSSLLDEFHPVQILYSNVVEPLVRQILVYERAVGLEKGERSAFLTKSLAFVGIGGGALKETAALF